MILCNSDLIHVVLMLLADVLAGHTALRFVRITGRVSHRLAIASSFGVSVSL